MCGIAGFWQAKPQSEATTRHIGLSMAKALEHRGPDDFGVWSDEAGICLAHRRLSIIDLSPHGHQPMLSASGRFVIAFNGEIYNFRSIRTELEQRGYLTWRGHSDTEVLLAAIETWGVAETLSKLVGMFAFALWDRVDRSLTLGRDRAGEKPLYYGWQHGQFLFGSEIGALRQHPACPAEIDIEALGLLTRFAYVPAPYSIYKGIAKLPPGTYLCLSAKDLSGHVTSNPKPYWSWMDIAHQGISNPTRGDPEQMVDALERLLKDVINRQMLADVPLGAFLSGGVDSSVIVALMQTQSDRPVKTFTIGFNEAEYNEAEHARAVAKHLGTEHIDLYVTDKDALDLIPSLPQIYTEPFADSSQLPTVLVSRLARQHVTVSLSGDGGDELFAGYNRYLTAERLWQTLDKWPRSIRSFGSSLVKSVPPDFLTTLSTRLNSLLPRNMRFTALGDKAHKFAAGMAARSDHELYDQVVSFWAPEALVKHYRKSSDRAWPPHNSIGDFTQWMMAQDSVTYLPDDILAKVDRAAMSASLETRVPFLDHRVIEFAWHLPMQYKIRDGVSKWLLRQVLYRHVPKNLIERPKMGFGAPIDRWLRGPLKEWAADLLEPGRLRKEGYFDADLVEKIWLEHQSGRRNAQHHLWNVLMFQAWLDTHAERNLKVA
ncbi:asparagine synthase (glutamine-hydrolysing) [Pandoraea thiooxydans]|uniref:asparagine synthase (glutamine-hydrolyzing) n=1 Tax=Pandoraea thiooxydans TaxID=445709 RepID=A0A0G3ESM0_9BURK|nr:asparagine synthase (glutamine-hydrolyzing) [Pandoraea thiooxydans]AKJ69014.1 asparagine synthase (glutamine-hydrolyzing) [Pandoraea thiooxydans]APR96556.1 asparagine synthase (glutamine-hydrolysing) [Pandoraea thiooxydans]